MKDGFLALTPSKGEGVGNFLINGNVDVEDVEEPTDHLVDIM